MASKSFRAKKLENLIEVLGYSSSYCSPVTTRRMTEDELVRCRKIGREEAERVKRLKQCGLY